MREEKASPHVFKNVLMVWNTFPDRDEQNLKKKSKGVLTFLRFRILQVKTKKSVIMKRTYFKKMKEREKGFAFEFFPENNVVYPISRFERKPFRIFVLNLLKKRILKIELAILLVLSAVLILLAVGCEPFFEGEPTTYCAFFRPDYTTVDIHLEYQVVDRNQPIKTALVKMYNYSPDGKRVINDLDGGELFINGIPAEFKKVDDVEGYYPVTDSIVLAPDSVCSVEFKFEGKTYTFSTRIPKPFKVEIPDTLNMFSDFNLTWDRESDLNETSVYLDIYDPINGGNMTLIEQYISSDEEVKVPFRLLAPTIYGWTGRLNMNRTHYGACDPAFMNDSKIEGICSFYKEFSLTYSK
jgi:hypothetical protein